MKFINLLILVSAMILVVWGSLILIFWLLRLGIKATKDRNIYFFKFNPKEKKLTVSSTEAYVVTYAGKYQLSVRSYLAPDQLLELLKRDYQLTDDEISLQTMPFFLFPSWKYSCRLQEYFRILRKIFLWSSFPECTILATIDTLKRRNNDWICSSMFNYIWFFTTGNQSYSD